LGILSDATVIACVMEYGKQEKKVANRLLKSISHWESSEKICESFDNLGGSDMILKLCHELLQSNNS